MYLCHLKKGADCTRCRKALSPFSLGKLANTVSIPGDDADDDDDEEDEDYDDVDGTGGAGEGALERVR